MNTVFPGRQFLLSLLVFYFFLSCVPTEPVLNKSSAATEGDGDTASDNSEGDGGGSDLQSLLSGQLASLGNTSLGSFGGSSEGSSINDDSSQITGEPSDIFWNDRFPKAYLTSYLNGLKGSTAKSDMFCPPYSFVVGQYSLYHQDEDGTEWADRQYRLKCQFLADGLGRTLKRSSNSSCVAATKEEYPDNYKEVYSCPEGKFLSGHATTFEGDKKARAHTFACCDIEHPDDTEVSFPEYLVYTLEHAGPQKNCYTEADATSYSRRYQWDYECPAHSLLYKITVTNVPETSSTEYYTEFESKPEDPIFGYECCQVGVQQDANAYIYGYSQDSSSTLPYDLYSLE